MGLTLRQLLCSGIAIGLAVLIYLWAKPLLGQETASWLCILAAAPIAAAGFLSYDGLPFEKFVNIAACVSLSATGSSIFPKLLILWNLLAIYPSARSVRPDSNKISPANRGFFFTQ